MSAEVKAETRGLLAPGLRRPHRITGYPDDAALLTEKVKRFDRLLRKADDTGWWKLAQLRLRLSVVWQWSY